MAEWSGDSGLSVIVPAITVRAGGVGGSTGVQLRGTGGVLHYHKESLDLIAL